MYLNKKISDSHLCKIDAFIKFIYVYIYIYIYIKKLYNFFLISCVMQIEKNRFYIKLSLQKVRKGMC